MRSVRFIILSVAYKKSVITVFVRFCPYPNIRKAFDIFISVHSCLYISFKIFWVRSGYYGVIPTGDCFGVYRKTYVYSIFSCEFNPIVYIKLWTGRLRFCSFGWCRINRLRSFVRLAFRRFCDLRRFCLLRLPLPWYRFLWLQDHCLYFLLYLHRTP